MSIGNLYEFLEPGFPYFTSEGKTLINYLKGIVEAANLKLGYVSNIETSKVVPNSLLEMTGHMKFYKQDIYPFDDEHSIKPMNCPGFISYLLRKGEIPINNFPIKLSEIEGVVFRTEAGHELTKDSLKRLHIFTQDDSHALFLNESHAISTIEETLEIMIDIYKMFGFELDSDNFRVVVTKDRPKDGSLGTDEEWKKSENTLREVLDKLKIKGIIPSYEDDKWSAAFYGPKINIQIKNSKDEWVQCGTIQLDNQMPKSAGLTYEGEDGQKHYPVMLHRAILGSYERAISILMDHYQKKFPSWLSPVKARILPKCSDEISCADDVAKKLYENGIITEIDYTDDPIEEKIKKLEDNERHFFIPYSIQLTNKKNEILVTNRDNGATISMYIEQFMDEISQEISNKSNSLNIGRETR